jgi:hypothetical protein
MRFGTKVLVKRGGGAPVGKPGCKRYVPGTLVGARGDDRWVRLDVDDPLDTIGWDRAGTVGNWGASAVTPFELTALACCDTGMIPMQFTAIIPGHSVEQLVQFKLGPVKKKTTITRYDLYRKGKLLGSVPLKPVVVLPEYELFFAFNEPFLPARKDREL